MQTKHLCVVIHISTKCEVGAVKPVIALQLDIFTDRSKAVLLLWIIFVIKVLCLSVYCSLLVTCWEKADLLALVCEV